MRYLSSVRWDRYASQFLDVIAVSHKQRDAAENVEMLILHLIFVLLMSRRVRVIRLQSSVITNG